MKTGMNMRSVRKRRGLTLGELSEICNIGRDELGKYEQGKITPRLKTVRRIAAALDVPVAFIQNGMGWTEPQAMEDWETARGDQLLRDGIMENLKESYGDADGVELDENDILSAADIVKASVPVLIEYMKDTRPEHEIICGILDELGVVREDSEEELIRRYALTDEQWEQIQPLLPMENKGKGRPFKSNRLILDGMLFQMKSGVAWKSLPKHFGRYKCITERLHLWCKMGIWQPIVDKMIDMKILDKEGFAAAEMTGVE